MGAVWDPYGGYLSEATHLQRGLFDELHAAEGIIPFSDLVAPTARSRLDISAGSGLYAYHIYIYICIYTCVYPSINVCAYLCLYIYMYICKDVCICTYFQYTHVCVSIYMYM